MFTGLVEEIGIVSFLEKHPKGVRLEIRAKTILNDISLGDSIAVNGCCLTVVEYTKETFACEIVSTTWEITSLSDLKTGDFVNLERAMSPSKRFGGHFVQGHIDGTGLIENKTKQSDNSTLVTIQAPSSLLRYMINKGSVTVDGVSLTIVSCSSDSFSFAMIPHTAEFTILGRKELSERVNLEVDLIAKYVEKLHG